MPGPDRDDWLKHAVRGRQLELSRDISQGGQRAAGHRSLRRRLVAWLVIAAVVAWVGWIGYQMATSDSPDEEEAPNGSLFAPAATERQLPGG